MASPRTLTVADAADELGVAPARVRALLASGALRSGPTEGTVHAGELADLARRGVVRTLDVAAVEGALDRALRRRLPGLLDAGLTAPLADGLDQALAPLHEQLAATMAEAGAARREALEADARARAAEGALVASQAQVRALEDRVEALQARPAGLFRRRAPRAQTA